MPRALPFCLFAICSLAPGCLGKPRPPAHAAHTTAATLSAEAQMVWIAAGPYRHGSSAAEREQAYTDYFNTRGRDSARKGNWFEREEEASERYLPAFAIDKHPVTQAAFAEFVRAKGLAGPRISLAAWRAQGFIQDYESEVRRYNWRGQEPPIGRAQHPVVLVTHAEAQAYCHWRGQLVGHIRVIPSADQFEKAARGPSGSAYPWGQHYAPDKLNSADAGPRDTLPVGSYPQGASAAGALDMAGQVFQWTSTPWPHSPGKMTVKGSAWDDHGGLGRAPAAHGRGRQVRHAIVGFRCASR